MCGMTPGGTETGLYLRQETSSMACSITTQRYGNHHEKWRITLGVGLFICLYMIDIMIKIDKTRMNRDNRVHLHLPGFKCDRLFIENDIVKRMWIHCRVVRASSLAPIDPEFDSSSRLSVVKIYP